MPFNISTTTTSINQHFHLHPHTYLHLVFLEPFDYCRIRSSSSSTEYLISSMEDRKEKNAPWLSVPQFGDWDMKGQVPDYSMDFSKIREMRKQNKRDVSRASLGNEEELISSTTTKPSTDHTIHHNYSQDHSPTMRRSIFSYFNCCVKA